jgi:transposase
VLLEGRACYDKKITEGKTPEEALRCLKRRISSAGHGQAAPSASTGAGDKPGNDTKSSATGSQPGSVW